MSNVSGKPDSIGQNLTINLTRDILCVSSTGYVIRTSCSDEQAVSSRPCALKRIQTMDEEPPDLAKLSHENVVQLFHHWTEERDLFLVMELMDGDLAMLMAGTKRARASPFSLPVAVDIMLQIAKGMLHLHEMGISHPHLKCVNVLYKLTENKIDRVGDVLVKLGGFGCSRPADMNSKNRDVLCFGLTCLEILTGDEWSDVISGAHMVPDRVVAGSSIPETTPAILRDCIVNCLNTQPTFSEIVTMLSRAKSCIMQTCKDKMMYPSESIETKITQAKTEELSSTFISNDGLEEIFAVHQLHPQLGDVSTCVRATLIFFHGFHKVPEEWRRTWMTRDNKLVWPQKWLPEDLGAGNIRVLSVSFDANSNVSNNYNRYDIGKNLVQGLVLSPRWKLGEIEEAIFLVGHSFGGVLIKHLVTEARYSVQNNINQQEAMKCEKFLKSLAKIVFYSVPHAPTGLEFESYISECRKIVALQRSSFLQSLQEDTRFIADMNQLSADFESAVPEKMKVLAFLEGKPMSKKRVLVTEKSCEGQSRSWEWQKIDTDNHFEVCRPNSKNHTGYRILLDHLQRHMNAPCGVPSAAIGVCDSLNILQERCTRMRSFEGKEDVPLAECIFNQLPTQIMECIFKQLQNSDDRGAASQVCKMWRRMDGLTRKSVYIPNCYSVAPSDLSKRFKHLEKIKITGKPRAYDFGFLVENWGGHAGPWIEEIVSAYPKLQCLHLRRMDVTDGDLELLAMKCTQLQKLKLHKCSGFSTMGLEFITQSCRSLRVLDLEESDDMEDFGGPWLQLLQKGEGTLESLNLASAGLEEENIKESLHVLAPRLRSISSLKVSDMELDNFFKILDHSVVPVLELGLGCYSSRPAVPEELAASFSHRLSRLKVLDLKFATMNAEIQIEVLRHCYSLEELELRSAVGDRGMQVIGESCKQLKRIRVDHIINSEYMTDYVTQKGMIAICEGCREVDFLVMYLSDVDNGALAAVGRCLPKLTDFRIVLLEVLADVKGFPLDEGVRSLLQGCPLLTRFSVSLQAGGLSDKGVGYIGEFGGKLKWVHLGCSGESDEGLRVMAEGCRQLESLELRGCPFGEAQLASSVLNMLNRLKYLWVQGVGATVALGAALVSHKPGFLVEFMAETAQILGYYTVTHPRTDYPISVCLIYPKDKVEELHEANAQEVETQRDAHVDLYSERYNTEYVENHPGVEDVGCYPGFQDMGRHPEIDEEPRHLQDGENVLYPGIGDNGIYLGAKIGSTDCIDHGRPLSDVASVRGKCQGDDLFKSSEAFSGKRPFEKRFSIREEASSRPGICSVVPAVSGIPRPDTNAIVAAPSAPTTKTATLPDIDPNTPSDQSRYVSLTYTRDDLVIEQCSVDRHGLNNPNTAEIFTSSNVQSTSTQQLKPSHSDPIDSFDPCEIDSEVQLWEESKGSSSQWSLYASQIDQEH